MPTTPSGTHHVDAIRGLCDVVRGLGLVGAGESGAEPLPDGQVYDQELLTVDKDAVTLPAVFVGKAPMPESRELADSGDYLVGYPCLVAVVFPSNHDPALTEAPARWRQEIEEATDFRRPAALSAAMTLPVKETRWQPLAAVDEERFYRDGLTVNAALVTVYVWKPRVR